MAMKRARSNYARRNVRRKYTPRSNNVLASRYRKRSFRKRSMRRGKSAVRRSLPDYTTVALKYTETFNRVFTTAPSNGYFFRMNSLHDMNESGVGGQPFGFDQYAAFFQKYRVFGLKHKVTFYNPNSPNTNDLTCTVWVGPLNSVPAGSDNQILRQLPRAQTKVMSLKQGSNKRVTIQGFNMCYKIQGCSKAEYNTDIVYEGFIGQNPAASPKLMIHICDMTSILTEGNMAIDVEFIAYTRLFRRTMLGMS